MPGQSGLGGALVQALHKRMTARGMPVAQVQAALDAWLQGHPDALGRGQRSALLSQLLKTCCNGLQDELAGWRVGADISPAQLGAAGYAAMTAPTALAVLRLDQELQPLHMAGVVFRHELQGNDLVARAMQVQGATRDLAFWSFVLACRLNLLLAGAQAVSLRRVSLPCPPPTGQELPVAHLGVELSYGSSFYEERHAIDVLTQPSPQSSPEVHRVVVAVARREAREVSALWAGSAHQSAADAPDPALLQALKTCIHADLDRGDVPTLQSAAQRLAQSGGFGPGIGVRQWQRRLAACQIGFRELVAEVRRARALVQLREGERPLADIAAEAGYAELSSFHRAVRRWTGQTPLAYRQGAASPDWDCV